MRVWALILAMCATLWGLRVNQMKGAPLAQADHLLHPAVAPLIQGQVTIQDKIAPVIPPAPKTTVAAPREEIRDRTGLVRFFTKPIADTPRNRHYLQVLNKGLDETYLGIDTDWFDKGGKGYFSREQTNTLGQLAFYYRTKGFKYYQDPKVLEKIRLAFAGVVKHISDEGKFTWTKNLNDYGYDGEVHEHGWRLEPLILALIWIGDQLPESERTAIETALLRASTWLATHPLIQHNNRGAVWCATTTLAGIYFNNKEFLNTVEKHAGKIISSIVLDDGECGEHTSQYGGGGPDANYSYTGWSYVYLYRVLSGKQELDGRLLQSLRWFSAYNTRSGCPVVSGASVRRRMVNPSNLQDILPALERYSHVEPFFADVAEHLLSKRESHLKITNGHIVSPLIWAMLEQGVQTTTTTPPDWHRNLTALFERREVHYALLSRQYQTGITFRGRTAKGYDYPLRGLQTFAYGDEYPILLHTDNHNSSTRADGIDTAQQNVEKGPQGWEVVLTKGAMIPTAKAELATIATRTATLWTLYAMTPTSMVVVYGGAKGDLNTRWVMNRQFVSKATLDQTKRKVTFDGRTGTIYYLKGEAKLTAASGPAMLEVTTPAPVQLFAFSNPSFNFQSYDAAKDELLFSDDSGRYRLNLKSMLDKDGNLNRTSPIRLLKAAN